MSMSSFPGGYLSTHPSNKGPLYYMAEIAATHNSVTLRLLPLFSSYASSYEAHLRSQGACKFFQSKSVHVRKLLTQAVSEGSSSQIA